MKPSAVVLAALTVMAVLRAGAEAPGTLYGKPMPVAAATRTIVILPSTRHVNVAQGEVIRFVIDGAEFAFSFNSPNTAAFNLQRVAPQGALDHPVTTYVRVDPDAEGLLGH